MSSELQVSHGDKGIRILDPKLPILAAEAAIDIDNMLLGGDVNKEAIHQLAAQLNNSFTIEGAGGTHHNLMDSATLTILGEVIADTEDTSSLEVEGLLKKVAEIANELSSENPLDNQRALERARDFCIALSRAAVSFNSSIIDLEPAHPFRK